MESTSECVMIACPLYLSRSVVPQKVLGRVRDDCVFCLVVLEVDTAGGQINRLKKLLKSPHDMTFSGKAPKMGYFGYITETNWNPN